MRTKLFGGTALVTTALLLSSACDARRDTQKQAALPSIRATHPSDGVTRIVLRAHDADKAVVFVAPSTSEIVATGNPVYFGLDDDAQGNPGNEGFEFKRFDDTLLIATRGEFVYIHFGLTMEQLSLSVPAGVEVTREVMRLNGDMAADLRPPGAPRRPEGRP